MQFFKKPERRCSFCNKRQSDVRHLIAGPGVFICEECVEICDNILENAARSGEPPHPPAGISICLVCKEGKAESDCVQVPDRGPVCRDCAGRVRAAAARSTEASTN